jgi:hypothetical protein
LAVMVELVMVSDCANAAADARRRSAVRPRPHRRRSAEGMFPRAR